MDNSTKITKHRSTLAPFECEHCGFMWYGTAWGHPGALERNLCGQCWDELDRALWDKYQGNWYSGRFDNTPRKDVCDDALIWIQDKTKKPLPRSMAKRYHRSVPKWMRSAINAGMVKANGHEAYVVYSLEQVAVYTEIADRSTLKSFKARL